MGPHRLGVVAATPPWLSIDDIALLDQEVEVTVLQVLQSKPQWRTIDPQGA